MREVSAAKRPPMPINSSERGWRSEPGGTEHPVAAEYSVETCLELAEQFRRANVLRPLRVGRHDPGAELTYDVTGVLPARPARVSLAVERFIGGGFAGQVYRVVVRSVAGGSIAGLEAGGAYAMKVLVPRSGFARAFRGALYYLGFQSPFQLQVNPSAARAAALWQKFIRRAARVRFGTERAVVDVLATFVDPVLGSCGEISEFLDGRTWRFEVDDRLYARRRRRAGQGGGPVGSPEYLAKRRFMGEMVRLLHDVGAAELARQYEWWTLKSQPNCLKRRDRDDDPAAGLTAVDFRAGLALLAVLPMCPRDLGLIVEGLDRGRWVQFDRGDPSKLRSFVGAHGEEFADMRGALAELESAERAYRDSQIDAFHHGLRLLRDAGLRASIREAAISGWRVANRVDADGQRRLRRSIAWTVLFWVAGLLPVLGGLFRRAWGRADYRAHYRAMLASLDYLRRAFRARAAEMLIGWHRSGRVGADKALRLARSPLRFLGHLALSVLPAMLHRMCTDGAFALQKLRYVFVRPVRLYFNAALREEWLREMLAEGRRHHMVSDEDAERILSRMDEPFIQKYLKSLAVHVCTLPVTQVVSVAVATWYVLRHPELTWEQASARFGAILVAFQVVPISPGSLVRGLYVLYLVIRERNFKDYNIAVFLGFFKYVGYLAFPIQMAYRYPALARFMAGHWATQAVHVVPVFGERGALLEHWVFDLFYNYPLTVRRRMQRRTEQRKNLPQRAWHGLACIGAAAAVLAAVDAAVWHLRGHVPTLGEAWWLTIWAPVLAGVAAAAWAGRMPRMKRLLLACLTGLGTALAYSLVNNLLVFLSGSLRPVGEAVKLMSWSAFVFVLAATAAAWVYETHAPAPADRPAGG